MKNVRISALIIGAVLLLLILTNGIDRDPQPVRIGFLNIAASLPLFIAEDNGFFSAEGIDIETYPIASSNQLVDGILAPEGPAFDRAVLAVLVAAAVSLLLRVV